MKGYELAAYIYRKMNPREKKNLVLNISEAILFMEESKQEGILEIFQRADSQLACEVRQKLI